MLDFVMVPLGMAGLAVAMLGLAWMALGEYRKLFRTNPKLLMSFEVFSVVADMGGPGYVAATLVFCGLWLLMLATIIGMVVIHGLLA